MKPTRSLLNVPITARSTNGRLEVFRLAFSKVLLGAVFAALGSSVLQAQQQWRTDGTSGTWMTGTNWSTNGGAASATGGNAYVSPNDAVFSENSTVTFATGSIGNVTVAAGKNVTISQAGTLSVAAARTFDIGAGSTLTWTNQNWSTAASSAGWIKNGAGTWSIGAPSNAWSATNFGATINAGTVIVSGSNAFGGGSSVLTLNGGTIQSSGLLSLSFANSITIGGNFTNTGTGNATFSGAVGLGSSTRTITNSLNSGSRIYSGIVSGAAGAGLTFDGAGAGQTYISNASNSFTGTISINGGEVGFTSDGAFGNASNTIVIDGGRLTASTTTGGAANYTLASTRGIQVGDGAGTSISVASTGTLTYGGVISDKSGETGSWSKQGAGTLLISGANTYTGMTSISNGTLSVSNVVVSGGSSNLGNATSAVALGDATNKGTLSYTGATAAYTRGFTLNAGGGQIDVTTAATNLTVATNAITGAGGLTKGGAGALIFNTANSYSGSTVIAAGTLRTDVISALPSGTNVTVGTSGATSNPGILNLNGTSQAIASLTLLGGSTSAANSGGVSIGTGGVLTVNGSVNFETGSGSTYPSTISGGTLNLGGSTRDFNVFNHINSTGDLVISSVIANGGINKLQTGLLRLDGANTHSGDTQVSAGTLVLNNVNALQNSTLNTGASGSQSVTFVVAGNNIYNLGGLSGADALAIGGNTISVGSNGSSTSYSGVLSSTGGGLVKTGSGTLTLSSTNTYTGTTTVSNGTLQIGNATTTGTLGSGSVINNSALVFNRSNAITVSNVISGNGSLTQAGSDTLTLSSATNSYTGVTNFNAGTVSIGTISDGGTNSSIGAATAASSNLVFAGGTLAYTGATATTNRGMTLNTGGGTINTTNNLGVSGVITGAAVLTKTGAGTLTLSGANNHGGTTVSAGAVAIGNNSALGTGTATLSDATTLRSDSTTARSISNNLAINGNVTLGDATNTGAISTSGTTNLGSANRTITTLSNVTLNGAVSNGSITKAGAGTLTLGAANTLASATTVNSGAVVVDHNSALGNQAVSVNAGASLLATDGKTISNAISLNQSVTTTGTGSVSWNFTGGTGSPSSSTGPISGGVVSLINQNGSGITFDSISPSTISGSSAGNNAGATVVNGGLNTNSSTAFQFTITPDAGTNVDFSSVRFESRSTGTGPSAFVLRANTLAAYGTDLITPQSQTADSVWRNFGTVANPLLISGAPTSTNAAPTTFRLYGYGGSGANINTTVWRIDDLRLNYTFSQTVVGSAAVLGTTDANATASFTGNITLNGANEFTSAMNSIVNIGSATGAVSGSGSITKTGLGNVALSGANTYTGNTTVSQGSLIISSGGAINSPAATVAVNGGELQVNGSVTAATVSVASGANLSGSGSISGAVSIASGANLSPGNSPGTLTVTGNLTMNGTYNWEVASLGSADLVDVNGILTLSGATLSISGPSLSSGKFTLFAYNNTTALTEGFTGWVNGGTVGNWMINYGDTLAGSNGGTGTFFITVTAIPEPASLLLVGLALASGLTGRRRRRTI